MNCFYCISFVIFGVVGAQDSTPCTTPNGETATCVPLLKCRVLLEAAATEERLVLQFVNESLCDEKTTTVCCGAAGNYTGAATPKSPGEHESKIFERLSQEEKKEYVLKNLLPSKAFCGMQHTDDYFYNSTETSVDEFPWLVYIIKNRAEHDKNFALRLESNCVGVLISNLYVLTSVSCYAYAQASREYSYSFQVMLGVHHIHKSVNCIGTPYEIDDCTEPALRLTIRGWNQTEEVVIFRLPHKIDYTDYTRPICLPLQPEEIPAAGSLVMVSGWGEEASVKGKRLKLKKRMKYTVMGENKDCSHPRSNTSMICGLPLANNTNHICTGDFGGPLMYRHKKKNWIAVGLTYEHPTFVCDEAQPVLAVRFTPKIVDWILEQIRP